MKYPTDEGTKYCLDIVKGKIISCKKIKQACQRHLDDLERVGDPDFPYHYDTQLVSGALNFVSIIPDVDTKKPLTLVPFQKWIVAMIFGWRRDDGGRRWKKGLISMARTNSKTQIASWLCSYDWFFGTPRYNRQIICGANSVDQADRLMEYNKSTIESLLKLNPFKRWGGEIDINFDRIKWDKYHSVMKRISDGTKGIDSMHATLAILDETHQCVDDEFVSKVSSGMVGNEESLLLQTSTAGVDPKVPLKREYDVLSKVLSGETRMDDNFIAIYEQDSEEEMYQPDTWEKSNPLMAYEPKRKALTKGLISERDSMIAKGETYKFLVKNMNLWQNAKQNRYISLKDWKSATIPEFDMNGRMVYIGYDQSMSSDDTTIGFDFPFKDNEGKECHFLFQHSFVPTKAEGGIEAKERTDRMPYRELEKEGWCTVTKDDAGLINVGQVYDWLMEFVDEYNLTVIAFCYDEWHADKMVKRVGTNTNWAVVSVRQGTKTLNAPTKDMRDRLTDKTLYHLDDPIMEAAFTNAILLEDNNGIKVDKDKNSEKIDSVDALMDAHSQAMFHYEEYENSDPLKQLENMSDDQLNDFFGSGNFSF